MSAYIVFTRTKTLDQKELETYWAGIKATIEGHPIEILVAYGKYEVLEGDPIEGIVIAKFPTVKAAKDWYYGAAYQRVAKHRQRGAIYQGVIVEVLTNVSKHVTISPGEAADRLAIRELIEAYARCAERRDAKSQMSLFGEDAHFVVYLNAKDTTPSMDLRSREALTPVFADLNKYDATTHFVGQSSIFTLTGDRATGGAYCLAHHVTVHGGKQPSLHSDTLLRWIR